MPYIMKVWCLGQSHVTSAYLESRGLTVTGLFLAHLTSVARFAGSLPGRPAVLAWDDMLRGAGVEQLQLLQGLVQPVVWSYGPTLLFPAGTLDRYTAVFGSSQVLAYRYFTSSCSPPPQKKVILIVLRFPSFPWKFVSYFPRNYSSFNFYLIFVYDDFTQFHESCCPLPADDFTRFHELSLPPSPSSDWLYLLGLNDWIESSVSGLYIDLYLPRNQLSLVSTTDHYSYYFLLSHIIIHLYLNKLYLFSLVILSSAPLSWNPAYQGSISFLFLSHFYLGCTGYPAGWIPDIYSSIHEIVDLVSNGNYIVLI